MLRAFKRAAVWLLVLMVVCIAGLYIYANSEAISQVVSREINSLSNSISDSYDALNTFLEERKAAGYSDKSTYEIKRIYAGSGSDRNKSDDQDSGEPVNYPIFGYPGILGGIDEQCEQVMVIMASGSEANLWIVERRDGAWLNIAGPLHCLIGENGLAPKSEKTDFDGKTPAGLTNIGKLYAGEIPDGCKLDVRKLKGGEVWVTDPESMFYNLCVRDGIFPDSYTDSVSLSQDGGYIDIGFNSERASGGAAILLAASDSPAASPDGSINISNRDFLRIAGLLSSGKNPACLIASADDIDYKIEKGMPENFVFLTDYAPEIREDSKYATTDNFMGGPINGYIGNRIVVTVEMAQLLKEVNESLNAKGLGLLVYDGYRPRRTEDNFFSWINSPLNPGNKETHYPTLGKDDLPGIYLARNSRHTRGIAVDLTLYDLVSGEPLDMGTCFDFFSPLSWYKSDSITPHQQNCRKILREAMIAGGFSPYEYEWWHFNLLTGDGSVVYDFVIPQ